MIVGYKMAVVDKQSFLTVVQTDYSQQSTVYYCILSSIAVLSFIVLGLSIILISINQYFSFEHLNFKVYTL